MSVTPTVPHALLEHMYGDQRMLLQYWWQKDDSSWRCHVDCVWNIRGQREECVVCQIVLTRAKEEAR